MSADSKVEESDTHQRIFIVGPFLPFHHGAADVGNDGFGGQNITMDVGNGCARIYCKFCLEATVSSGHAAVTERTSKT